MKLSAEAAIDRSARNYSVKERGKKSGVLELSLLGRVQSRLLSCSTTS
jgi:hypothetical protein